MSKSLLLFILLTSFTINGCKDNSKQLPTLDRSSDIAGPDLDGNGIRDDVDVYINKLDLTESQRKATKQVARAIQTMMMTDTSSDAALREASKKSFRASKCLNSKFEDVQLFMRLSKSIKSITVNTKERAKRYNAYNAARSGSVSQLPNRDTCDE